MLKIKQLQAQSKAGLKKFSIFMLSLAFIFSSFLPNTPFSQTETAEAAVTGSQIVANAKQYNGRPYAVDYDQNDNVIATYPNGFYCNTMVQQVLRNLGIAQDLQSGTAQTIWNTGSKNPKYKVIQNNVTEINLSLIKDGDLIFHRYANRSTIHHVAFVSNGGTGEFGTMLNPIGTQFLTWSRLQIQTRGPANGDNFYVLRIVEDQGDAKIVKTNEDGQRLAGVTFNVTTSTGQTESLTTNSNGEAITRKYDAGTTVTFTEVGAPINYVIDSTPVSVKIGGGTTVTANKSNNFKRARLRVYKNDEDGKPVANVKFHVSTNRDMSNPVEIVSDATGYTNETSIAYRYGTPLFYKEVSAPDDYVIDPTVKDLVVEQGTTITANASNIFKKAKLRVYKNDEDGVPVANVTFHISRNKDMSNPVVLTTGANGYTNETPEYYRYGTTLFYKEISAPDQYIVDTSTKQVTVKQNTTITLNASNEYKKGRVKIIKKDATSDQVVTARPATYSIYKSDGTYMQDITTSIAGGDKGSATSTLLRYGDYYMVEKNSPQDYLVKPVRMNFKIRENNVTVVTSDGFGDAGTQYNKQILGDITLKKYDKQQGNTSSASQGDATIQDATYKLVAQDNILNPWDNSVRFPAGTEIYYNANTKAWEKMTGTETEKEAKRSKTSASGQIFWTGLPIGNYYAQESTPSNGYLLNTDKIQFSLVSAGQTIEKVTDGDVTPEQVISAPIRLQKFVTETPGTTEIYYEVGAKFEMKLASDVEKFGWDKAPLAKTVNPINNTIVAGSQLVTNTNGQFTSGRFPYGTYVLRQVQAGTVNGDMKLNLLNDQTIEIKQDSAIPTKAIYDKQFTNSPEEFTLGLAKKDAETGKIVKKEGFTFKIRDMATGQWVSLKKTPNLPNSETVSEFVTNKDGIAILPDKLKSTAKGYEIFETKAPLGYVLNSTPVHFGDFNEVFETDDENPTIKLLSLTFSDKQQKVQVEANKLAEQLTSVDGEDGNIQFNYEKLFLEGAVFNIIAEEEIRSADNSGTIVYEKGQVVQERWAPTSENRKSNELPLNVDGTAKYRIKEIEVPSGYTRMEDAILEYTYGGDKVQVVGHVMEKEDKRPSISLDITKFDKETAEKLADTEFGLYNKNDILGKDGQILIHADTLIDTAITGKDGVATFDADIMNGHYYIKELKAPAGYYTSGEIIDVNLSWVDGDTTHYVAHPEFKNEITKVYFGKDDITTGTSIDGAEMAVYRADENGKPIKDQLVDSWVSSSTEKHLIKGMELNTKYVLVEESAPYGYVLTDNIVFTVKDDATVDQIVQMSDEYAVGDIWVTKTGEGLVNFEEPSAEALLTGYFNYIFNYDEKPMSDVEFDIHANKDVVHPDKKSENFYNEGDLVAQVKTDNLGIAKIREKLDVLPDNFEIKNEDNDIVGSYIPLGSYKVTETSHVDGFTQAESKVVEINYVNETTPVVFYNEDIQNVRQKVQLHITKVDADNKTVAVEGGEFTLYNTDEITAIDKEGVETTIAPNTAIARATSDDKGFVSFDDVDLPLGHYYAIETKAPIGYVMPEEVRVDFDLTWKDNNEEYVIVETTVENIPSEIIINKLDAKTMNSLEGATLSIYPQKEGMGAAFTTFVTTDETTTIKYLETDTVYVLHELTPAKGNVTADDILFTIDKDGTVRLIPSIETDEVIDPDMTVTPEGEDSVVTELPELDQETVESGDTTTPDKDSDIDSGMVVKPEDESLIMEDKVITMVDDFTKVEISKVDITSEEEIEGAKLTIKDDEGKVVETWVSGEDGKDEDGKIKPHYMEKLPIGDYTLIEEMAPTSDGYVKADDVKFTIEDHGRLQTVVMKDDYTKVEISKVDITSEEEIEGAKLSIKDSEDKIVETWVTGEDGKDEDGKIKPHYMEKLPVGDYTLVEEMAPTSDGYVKAEDVKFTVEEHGEIQKVVMKDDYTKVEISKVDFANDKALAGAKLEIRDANNEVYDTWESTDKPHMIEYMPVGDYLLVEVDAPKGYDKAEAIKFKVEETGEIQKVVMKDKKTPDKIQTATEDYNNNVVRPILLLVGASGLLSLLAMSVRKKKLESKNK